MNAKTGHEWSSFLALFLDRNQGKPSRLGVFVGEDRGIQDFWIEDGLPLRSVTVEPREGSADVEMVFGSKTGSEETAFTHHIAAARSIRFGLGLGEYEDTLEITDDSNNTAVLRFEEFLDKGSGL